MAAQITAVIIFLIMFALIITEKIPRHIATTICSVATIILVFGVCMHSATAFWDTLNFQTFTSVDFWRAGAEATESTKGINWQTIIFIAGMMIMVEGMALSGFFSWLCLTIAKAVRYNTTKIFIMFMILAFVLSMFIDSITVILFLAAITITQSKLLQFDPIPVIIAEIFHDVRRSAKYHYRNGSALYFYRFPDQHRRDRNHLPGIDDFLLLHVFS